MERQDSDPILIERLHTQSEENGIGLNTPIDPTRMRLATTAAEVVFNNPDADPEFEPNDVASACVAVKRLESLFASAPGTFTALLEGAKEGAKVLSGNRLQGLSEIIQNADDIGATEVHFLLQPDALLIAHNGRPVRLRDVHALATPWVTTKRHDSKALGRFGIGLMTLQALSNTLELHSGPYDVSFGDPIVTAIETISIPHGFANIGDTVFRVPLVSSTLDPGVLSAWAEAWDDPALLFCNSVRRITIYTSNSSSRTLGLQWEELTPRQAVVGGADTNVRRRRATAPDGRMWNVYTAESSSPEGVRRAHKATGSSVPIGVALALNSTDRGQLYAGLPVAPLVHAMRVNAQFDPLTNRQDLADTPWNTAISKLAADLWNVMVIDLFETDPSAAWRSIPLPTPSARSGTGMIVQFESMLVRYARERLPKAVMIRVGDTRMPLVKLAWEVPRLTSILSEKEIAWLAGLPAALPFSARDQEGRWREVLSSWRESGAGLVQPISVSAALKLFGRGERSAQKIIALTAAALDEHENYRLALVPCIMAHDGSALRPPARTDLWMFVTSEVPFARELGVAQLLHEAYKANEPNAKKVMSWLRSLEAINNENNVISVLRRLAVAGQAGKRIDQPLADSQLRAMRDAFETLNQKDRERLGPGVGQAIMIDGYQFGKEAQRIPTHASPAHMYLPKIIDKESESFAVAAGNTPELIWVDQRYATVLRSPLGRAGIGAYRFLRLLGAETAPRLSPHPGLYHRYQNERQRGLASDGVGYPRERARALNALRATYTLEDQHCPDLIAVLTDISRESEATQRRLRASALLATIGRAWDRFSEAAEVTAAVDNYKWQPRNMIKAFWLWQAAPIPWLDDSASKPTIPMALRLRTSGTIAVYGPGAEGYLHEDLHRSRLDNVLALFGVTGEPNTRDLVARLQNLQESGPSDVAMLQSETSIIYQVLGNRLASRVQVPGDLSTELLRQAFEVGEGLILTNLGWQRPSQVLVGAPMFGNRRAFTPSIPSTVHLWSELRVRKPETADCIDVLVEIAKNSRQYDTAQQTIVLETLRYLAAELNQADNLSNSLKQKLAKLPLWTGERWTRTRPIYAINDPILADSLRSQVAVWLPGGELAQFAGLLVPLRLTEVPTELTLVVPGATAKVDEEATELLRAAVLHLREDFARNDPETGNSLRIPWDRLSQFELRIAPDLRVEINVPNHGPLMVPVNAVTDSRNFILYVTKLSLMTSVTAGGQAIAGLFTANRRSVAQAWLAACDNAKSGRDALRLELAKERQKAEEAQRAADISKRMADLQNQTQIAHSQQRSSHAEALPRTLPSHSPTAIPPSNPSSHEAVSERKLVNPSHFQLVDTRGHATGVSNDTEFKKANIGSKEADREATSKTLPTPKRFGVPLNEHAKPRAYTEIEKESVGLALVRQVFASDEQEIRDLRTQHGVGADAVDALDRFFELKVYSGAEPDRIVLEYSQIRRAMSTPNFFLVVVSELEGENTSPKVRFIIDPLSQLSMSESSSVIFTGVHSSKSVVYRFKR